MIEWLDAPTVETAARPVRVVAAPRPFSAERVEFTRPEGATIRELVEAAGVPSWGFARVFIGDHLVEREWWAHVRPRGGQTVTIRAVPMGGGGGGGGKDILRMVALIAVAVVAIAVTWYLTPIYGALVAGVAGALVSVAGSLLVNALIPPQMPKLGRLSGQSSGGGSAPESPTLSITGARNTANPYGPIPKILGKHRVFPALGAQTFTEVVGNDQYLRMLFVVGYGPLELSAMQIGDTPIDQFVGVEMEIRQGFEGDGPLSLFPADISEDALSILLTQAGGPQSRRTRDDVDEISVDIAFPNGLVRFEPGGTRASKGVEVLVEYSPVASGTWTQAGTLSVVEATSTLVRRGLRWSVSRGTYEVRLRRLSEDVTDPLVNDLVAWSALRSIRNEDPISLGGLCKVALRIKATDQLNGVIDTFNLVAHSIAPDWDLPNEAWIERATSNPASLYRDTLQGSANARAVADSRIYLSGGGIGNEAPGTLEEWHRICRLAGYEFNHVVDYRTTVYNVLRDIAGAGRATFGMKDSKYSVVIDRAQSTPVQFFTPRNSWGFKGRKVFPDTVHAWKVRFVNPEADWQQDEVIVYDDGYDASNATRFEVLETLGVTSAAQAWKLGRYHLAVSRLRPETYELNADIEHIVCTRGDLVRVTHDIPLWGLGWGRIKSVAVDGGGNATAITVDEVLTMEAGKTYSVRIRKSDGTNVLRDLVTVAGEQTTLTFTSTIPSATIPAKGDLVMFGEQGRESVELIVKEIEPGADFTARLILVDAAPAVHTSDTGTIPPFNSNITRPPALVRRRPPVPVISSIVSDESALLGTGFAAQARVLLSLHFASGTPYPARFVEGRFRRVDADASAPWAQVYSPVAADAVELALHPVEDGVEYDIRVRSHSAESETSEWVSVRHLVIGRSTPPPDVVDFRIENEVLRWTYPTPPADFVGFRLREQEGQSGEWASATDVHDGLLSVSEFAISRDLHPRSFLLKAVDAAGNESLTAALLIVNLGDALVENVILDEDLAGAGFPGEIRNGTLFLGDLVADDTGGAFWAEDTQLFWPGDDAALFWDLVYKQLQYTAAIVPSGAEAPCQVLLDFEVTGESWRTEYALDGVEPFWPASDSDNFWNYRALVGAGWTP